MLFSSDSINLHTLRSISLPSISSSSYVLLNAPFTANEIKCVVWKMGQWKALGFDGLQIGFYMEKWEVVGTFITQTILALLNHQLPFEEYNHIDVALIPKAENPQISVDFRPIGLSNTIYKIAAKVLAKRMNSILPDIINETQGVYALERLELIHHIVNSPKTSNHTLNLTTKLDLSKAFDRVDHKLHPLLHLCP